MNDGRMDVTEGGMMEGWMSQREDDGRMDVTEGG